MKTDTIPSHCEPGGVCHFPMPHTSPEQIAQELPAAPECPPHLRVRLGRPEDAPAIAAIGARQFAATHAAAFAPDDLSAYLAQAFDVERLRADLADPTTHFLVAYDDNHDQVIGFLRLHPDPAPSCVSTHHPVELARFYLDQPWIGHGVGKLLMQQALAQAAADGYDSVWLHVWDHNEHALSFYKHWGYAAMCNAELAVGHSLPCLLVMEHDLHQGLLDLPTSPAPA